MRRRRTHIQAVDSPDKPNAFSVACARIQTKMGADTVDPHCENVLALDHCKNVCKLENQELVATVFNFGATVL